MERGNHNFHDNKIRIELEKIPQFGTYCREIKNTNFFVPFYPNDKHKIPVKYSHLEVDSNYLKKESFFIFLNSGEDGGAGTIKIEMKLKNIELIDVQTQTNSVGHHSSDNSNQLVKTFYFYLNTPPKIFKKISKNRTIIVNENYIESFSKLVPNFAFENHYHVQYEKSNKLGQQTSIKENIFVEHKKNSKEMSNRKMSEEITIDVEELNDFSSFIRVDSYLSTTVEYTNFFLLNLIMKIKINFYNEEEASDFIRRLKFGNMLKEHNGIISIPDKSTKDQIDSLIRKKTKYFYSVMLNLHFNLQYAILCLITQKRLNIFSFDCKLLERLHKLSCEEQNTATFIIEMIIKEKTKINVDCDLLGLFNSYYENSIKLEILSMIEKEKQNIDTMKSRTIEITPSMIYYKPPILEKQNHILRKYVEYKENFLKINFVDEELNKIFFSSTSMWVLINFLQNTMLEGLIVGSRHFEFLSASNSQMKNASFWFFCLEGSRFTEIEQLIKELGDFTKETNIHKNAARRGQCLSTTSFIKKLKPSCIKRTFDVERNGYNFTDGIGMISINLALECAKSFKLDYASAFQVRLGGIKGILAVNPDITEDEMVLVRPSMIKFESADTELGIIRCSTFSQGYLNRQIITLLNTLGVPKEIFINMLKKDLSKYDELINSPNDIAEDRNNSSGILKKCYFFTAVLNHFSMNKIPLNKEPFMSSLLLNIAISRISDLKSKGKILDKYSAVLLGVIDETNSLEEGEVYVNINNDQNNNYVIKNSVIVTKNPCLHPGDIRILRCNPNCEKLSHMINVIVFSSKGRRPVQNEISGGDLDGDSYFVSWNENLLNTIKLKNLPSLEETKNSSQNLKKKEIKMKDIVTSYIDYMRNDTIALISNSHAAFADADLGAGAFSEKCMKLSELFLTSIDAPKTGNFIKLKEFQEKGLILKQYPDFLDSNSYSSYESPGILGQLYRLINIESYLDKFEYNNYVFNYLEDYIINEEFISDNCHFYVLRAYDIYCKYQNEIKNLMNLSQVLHESEFFLCEKLHDKKRNKQFKQNDFFAEINNIRDTYRNIIFNSFENVNFDVASAIYVATYLNEKSIKHFHQFFVTNQFKEFIQQLVQDNRISDRFWKFGKNQNFVSKEKSFSYDQYMDYIERKKEFKGYSEIINNRRIFSLPWLIKEVRDKLFRK